MEVYGIRLEKAGHLYYTQVSKVTAIIGDYLVVLADCQAEVAQVKQVFELATDEIPATALKVLRLATPADLLKVKENEKDAKAALVIAKKQVQQTQLGMKLVSAEYALDRQRLVINFTADGRIDFRELVKALAATFKTRIELHQIGVRDEAKILGGIGPCGRTLCCATFLGEFVPVSIKMAKDQDLSLNPTKISGICGRLLCCLQFEEADYEASKMAMPDYGTTVTTPDGTGRVVGLNLLSQILRVRLNGKSVATNYQLAEVTPV